MTKIKICGIREEAHALAAVEAGADFIGVVFAPGRRQITPDKARHIVSVVKKRNHHVEVVGVFVNMPATEVNKVADFCALDWVQLSGDEPWEYCHEIDKPIIKATRISQQCAEEIYAELDKGAKLLSTQKFIALLDSQVEGTYGGTGLTFNWKLAQQVAKRFPIIIAGGLDPENVAQAIEIVLPWGVDVSSGVETEGVKDIDKIKAFVGAVRKADASYVSFEAKRGNWDDEHKR
jgi:phosphoribosylanthranilate isomerase